MADSRLVRLNRLVRMNRTRVRRKADLTATVQEIGEELLAAKEAGISAGEIARAFTADGHKVSTEVVCNMIAAAERRRAGESPWPRRRPA